MSEQNQVAVGHEYDGIREYDNPTPGWWHLIFFATVLFSAFYWIIWEMDPDAPTLASTHEKQQAAVYKMQFAKLGTLKQDEATLLSLMGDSKWLAVGESMYKANCASCHAADGHGMVGPNLTDDKYGNVKAPLDIVRVIADGANSGAMPAWRNRLNGNELMLVSAYVASLRGRNLSGPGLANDHEVAPWPQAPAKPDGQTGSSNAARPAGSTGDGVSLAPSASTQPNG
ncbi:MAG: c-type cytochrome [Phycisphaerales bacterium]|jgi:cytochrome c oxidase cbb3-type subunit 3|nr:c-type cytochrome [Phycisphaerales bacterium]